MGDNCKKKPISWRNSLSVPRPTGMNSQKYIPVEGFCGANTFAQKPIAHKYGLLHKSVHIVIISSDGKNILLQQRGMKKKQWKGYWDIIGEHVVQGDDFLIDVAKNVFQTEVGKKWRNPTYEFDLKEKLDYTHGGVTRTDYESKRVYVIIADDIDNNAIETMNNELKEKGEQETIQFRWFDKNEFDKFLDNGEVVPQGYFSNSPSYHDFKTLFREIARTLGQEPNR